MVTQLDFHLTSRVEYGKYWLGSPHICELSINLRSHPSTARSLFSVETWYPFKSVAKNSTSRKLYYAITPSSLTEPSMCFQGSHRAEGKFNFLVLKLSRESSSESFLKIHANVAVRLFLRPSTRQTPSSLLCSGFTPPILCFLTMQERRRSCWHLPLRRKSGATFATTSRSSDQTILQLKSRSSNLLTRSLHWDYLMTSLK